MSEEIITLQKQLYETRQKLAEARRNTPPESVGEYTFKSADGSSVTLSDLFRDKSELIVIHNMGKSCVYCTLWADGFNGVAAHLADRAAFVVISPDDHATQQEFAQSRGWTFDMASCQDNTFAKDMGFESAPGQFEPGVSTFPRRSEDGAIVRTGHDNLGPGDDFCSVWHLFDLLPTGANGWSPKYTYA